MLEIEQKFRVEPSLTEQVRVRLGEFQAEDCGMVEQSDQYLAHPGRDFAQTDEALRIRSVNGRNVLTYKGPRHLGAAKSREEIELTIGNGSTERDATVTLFRRLGFTSVLTVEKRREQFRLRFEGREFEVAFDTCPPLGSFVEVETLCDEAERAAAETAVLELAGQLGLTTVEHRSYLAMLLEQLEADTR